MNKEIKEKWVAALRSGRYQQGTHVLKKRANGEYFCCLGVLCELYAKENSIGWAFNMNTAAYQFLGEDKILPPQVRIWSELNHANPRVIITEKNFDKGLAELNDNGASFEEIADLIEKNL